MDETADFNVQKELVSSPPAYLSQEEMIQKNKKLRKKTKTYMRIIRFFYDGYVKIGGAWDWVHFAQVFFQFFFLASLVVGAWYLARIKYGLSKEVVLFAIQDLLWFCGAIFFAVVSFLGRFFSQENEVKKLKEKLEELKTKIEKPHDSEGNSIV